VFLVRTTFAGGSRVLAVHLHKQAQRGSGVRGEAMSLTAQILVLVLSFPAAGLLLYVLTIEEMRMLGDPAGRKPRQRAANAQDRTLPARQKVILSLAHRQHERAASAAAAADQEAEAKPAVTVRRAG
jgi:hypothetical protein